MGNLFLVIFIISIEQIINILNIWNIKAEKNSLHLMPQNGF